MILDANCFVRWRIQGEGCRPSRSSVRLGRVVTTILRWHHFRVGHQCTPLVNTSIPEIGTVPTVHAGRGCICVISSGSPYSMIEGFSTIIISTLALSWPPCGKTAVWGLIRNRAEDLWEMLMRSVGLHSFRKIPD